MLPSGNGKQALRAALSKVMQREMAALRFELRAPESERAGGTVGQGGEGAAQISL